MPQVMTDNPLAYVFVMVVLIVLGWGGRGFWLNLRKDKRDESTHDADLLSAVRKVAREEVVAVAERAAEDRQYYDEQLHRERVRVARLEGRVEQLTQALRSAGVTVPSWKPWPEEEIVAMITQADITKPDLKET